MVEEMQNKQLSEVTFSCSFRYSVVVVKLQCSRQYCAGCSSRRSAFLLCKRALQGEGEADSRPCNLSEHKLFLI